MLPWRFELKTPGYFEKLDRYLFGCRSCTMLHKYCCCYEKGNGIMVVFGGVSYLLHSYFNILTTCNGTVRNGGPQMKSEIILVIMTIKYF